MIGKLGLGKLIQLSMDGVNVNWDVVTMLNKQTDENEFLRCIGIGNGGLLFVDEGFQMGTSFQNNNDKNMLTLNALTQIYQDNQLDQVLLINFLIHNYITTSAFCLCGRSVYLLSFYHMTKVMLEEGLVSVNKY